MGFSFLSNLFKKKTSHSPEIKSIKAYAKEKSLLYFHDRELFHLTKRICSKTLLLDPHYALYIIESVDWEFKKIAKAKASSKKSTKNAHSDVEVDTLHNFISQKFNEVLHADVCPIVNILHLTHITYEEYLKLDKSFHTLLPTKRLIFKNSTMDEISQHLHHNLRELPLPIDTKLVQSSLFIDSCILNENAQQIVTLEQQEFIKTPLQKLSSLNAPYSSGKTNIMLLKVIREKLTNPNMDITIIVSTHYASDNIRQTLLELTEYAIVEVDLNSIKVLTTSNIGSKLKGSGYLFCDDVQLYSKAFLQKLLQMKKSYHICFMGYDIKQEAQNFTLTHTFKLPPSINYEAYLAKQDIPSMTFIKGNLYMNVILLLQKLLSTNEKILIVLDDRDVAKLLYAEINDYYDNICAIIDTTLSLSLIKRNRVEIININELSMFTCKQVILSLTQVNDKALIEYALSRASEHIYCIEK